MGLDDQIAAAIGGTTAAGSAPQQQAPAATSSAPASPGPAIDYRQLAAALVEQVKGAAPAKESAPAAQQAPAPQAPTADPLAEALKALAQPPPPPPYRSPGA